MPSDQREVKALATRQSTRVLRSTRPATAPTVQSLLDSSSTHDGDAANSDMPSDARHLPAELINRITALVAADDDRSTLLSLMRVGPTWNRTAAAYLYESIDFGGHDRFQLIYGLDKEICWDLPWAQLGRGRKGRLMGGTGCLERRSRRKIMALSMVQNITVRRDDARGVWVKWVVDQIVQPGGLFAAVRSLRLREGIYSGQDVTFLFGPASAHFLFAT